MEITLHKLGQVIARCWEVAEHATARVIAEEHHFPGEEDITTLLKGKLRTVVRQASDQRLFENAFVADIRARLPGLGTPRITRFSGLIARVNFHNRRHEGLRSASDLGIVIRRPSVSPHGSTYVSVERDHTRALLAQAKLGKNQYAQEGVFKWGRLTKPQERLIPQHHDHFALLLYRLRAESTLEPFRWQLCQNHAVREIKDWLRFDTFPRQIGSGQVLRKLSTGEIGTDSSSAELVDPVASRTRAIEIRVFWPDGAGPPERMAVGSETHRSTRQLIQS